MNEIDLWHEDNIGEISTIGWVPRSGLPFDEWERVMGGLFQTQRSLNWIIGDGLNYGEYTYGEAYAQAIEITGWEYQRLADVKYVASKVPYDLRNQDLTWTHHKYVAPLDMSSQKKWLDEAAEKEWTTAQLKSALNGRAVPQEAFTERKARDKRRLLTELLTMYELNVDEETVREWVRKLMPEEKRVVMAVRDTSAGLVSFCDEILTRLNGTEKRTNMAEGAIAYQAGD